jgi:hypothetical protein
LLAARTLLAAFAGLTLFAGGALLTARTLLAAFAGLTLLAGGALLTAQTLLAALARLTLLAGGALLAVRRLLTARTALGGVVDWRTVADRVGPVAGAGTAGRRCRRRRFLCHVFLNF